jgi:CheY-like chemotaxis protein
VDLDAFDVHKGGRQADETGMDRGTVLICDDDAVLRSLVERLLIQDGWVVTGSVENAIEAINLTRALRPDVVVLDVSMVGLSGIEAIPELVESGSVVVVCSAFADFSDSARRAGAAAVVDKSDLAGLPEVIAAVTAVPSA